MRAQRALQLIGILVVGIFYAQPNGGFSIVSAAETSLHFSPQDILIENITDAKKLTIGFSTAGIHVRNCNAPYTNGREYSEGSLFSSREFGSALIYFKLDTWAYGSGDESYLSSEFYNCCIRCPTIDVRQLRSNTFIMINNVNRPLERMDCYFWPVYRDKLITRKLEFVSSCSCQHTSDNPKTYRRDGQYGRKPSNSYFRRNAGALISGGLVGLLIVLVVVYMGKRR